MIDRCLQLHGGYGYINEYPIARLYADNRVNRIYGGTTEVMKTIIAKRHGPVGVRGRVGTDWFGVCLEAPDPQALAGRPSAARGLQSPTRPGRPPFCLYLDRAARD